MWSWCYDQEEETLSLPGGGPPWFWVCCKEPSSCLILSEKLGCLIRSSVDWFPEAP